MYGYNSAENWTGRPLMSKYGDDFFNYINTSSTMCTCRYTLFTKIFYPASMNMFKAKSIQMLVLLHACSSAFWTLRRIGPSFRRLSILKPVRYDGWIFMIKKRSMECGNCWRERPVISYRVSLYKDLQLVKTKCPTDNCTELQVFSP